MPRKLEEFSPEQLALLAPLIAIALSEGLTIDEAAVLGSFITSVGDLIVTIGAQRALLGEDSTTTQQPETGGAKENSPTAQPPETGGTKENSPAAQQPDMGGAKDKKNRGFFYPDAGGPERNGQQ